MAHLEGDCQDWLERCLADDRSDSDEQPSHGNDDTITEKSPDDRKVQGTYSRLRSASKPHSTPLTLKWLEENYEIAEGVCIPRSTLYVHYLDYCEKNDTQPVNAASFGKIIRQQFPQLTTRRLGTRGQSKYHYYGIGVREESRYYELSYSAKGVQSTSDGKKDNAKQIIAYSPRSKLGTLLPDFPDIKDIKLPANVAEDKVLTFLMMYRTHCQRILDTVIRANFDEVQNFLLHFWQGMPGHIKSILDSGALVTLVGVCDTILYTAIANVLMPTVLQPLPDSLTQVIRKFSVQLDVWLRQALDSLPCNLQKIKFDLARRFSQVLKRQTSLNHLCQAARTVIHSTEITSQMLDDWLNVDLNSIVKQTLYTMAYTGETEHDVIVSVIRDFEILLEDQASLESYIEWLDNMVDRCVVKKSVKQPGSLNKLARQFLLMWSCFGTRIIRDMTLHSAPSFGSFHLLHLMFDEYVLYTVENLHNQEKANELLRVVTGETTLDILEDSAVADSKELKTGCYVSAISSDKPTEITRNPLRNTDCAPTFGVDSVQAGYTHGCPVDGTPFFQQSRVETNPPPNGIHENVRGSPYHMYSSTSCQSRLKQPSSYQNSLGILSYAPSTFVAGCQPNNTAYDWSDWSVPDQFQATGSCPVPRISTNTAPGATNQCFASKAPQALDNQLCRVGIQNGCLQNDILTQRDGYCDQTSVKKKTILPTNSCGSKPFMDSFQYDVGNIM